MSTMWGRLMTSFVGHTLSHKIMTFVYLMACSVQTPTNDYYVSEPEKSQ